MGWRVNFTQSVICATLLIGAYTFYIAFLFIFNTQFIWPQLNIARNAWVFL